MKLKVTLAICALLLIPAGAYGDLVASYSWEDGGTVLDTRGNVSETNNVTTPVYDGNRALELIEDPLSSTPEGWVAHIEGLVNGDEVTVGFWAYDVTEGGSPSLRIWGHHSETGDYTSDLGSAGGNSLYSGTTGNTQDGDWWYLEHTWTFDDEGDPNQTAIGVEARMYSGSGAGENVHYLDLITVSTTNEGATIIFAPEPASLVMLLIGGLALRRRR